MADVLAAIGNKFGVDLNLHEKKGRDFALLLGGTALFAGLIVAVLSPWKVLALAIGLTIFYFTFKKPELTLLLLAVYTPFEPFLLKFVNDELYVYARYFSESLIYVLLAAAAYRLFLRQRKWQATPLDLPFLFFLLVAIASILINAVPAFIGILGLRQIIRFILLFFVIVVLDPDRDYIRRFTVVMLSVGLFEAVLGTIQAFVGAPMDRFLIPSESRFFDSIQLTNGTTQFWDPGTRVFATLGRFDQLGTFLCFFMLLAAGLLYYVRSRNQRQALWIFLLACIPGFVMTESRASWFGFLGGLFVLGAILMKDRRIKLAFVAAIVAALAYLGVAGLAVRYMTEYPGQTPVERLFEAFSFERWRGEYYGLGRLFWLVQTPLVVVRSSPLFGVGPGQFGGGAAAALQNMRVYEKLNLPFGVAGTGGYIDNNWFSLWGETGTLGVIFYVWMIVALAGVALVVWRRSKDPFAKGLALGFFGCLLAISFQAFLATYLEVRTLALYFWIFGAFMVVLGRRERLTA